jgi:hypothetical protein
VKKWIKDVTIEAISQRRKAGRGGPELVTVPEGSTPPSARRKMTRMPTPRERMGLLMAHDWERAYKEPDHVRKLVNRFEKYRPVPDDVRKVAEAAQAFFLEDQSLADFDPPVRGTPTPFGPRAIQIAIDALFVFMDEER